MKSDHKLEVSWLKKSAAIIYKIEDAFIVFVLLLMMGLAVFQIISRNFFGAGYLWTEVLTRVLVLWIALLGAMAASRKGSHISIDVLSKFFPRRIKLFSDMTVQLFTTVLCLIIAWHSVRFAVMEYEYGALAFGKVPVWVCQLIIPIGFIVIGLRYLILTFQTFIEYIQSKSQ